MKLSEYIQKLQKVLEKYGDLECYTRGDADQGNGYTRVDLDISLLQ